MSEIISVPEVYTPYKNLTICSNKLINGRVQVTIGSLIPFLVGKGTPPKIWLYIMPEDFSGKAMTAVSSNRKVFDELSVLATTSRTTITFSDKVLIDVDEIDEDTAVIVSVDLRPMGTNIHGNTEGLYIGDQIFKENVFQNVDSMIDVKIK